METTESELTASDRTLAVWLRRRLKDRVPADMLARLEDSELLAQYNEHKIEAIKNRKVFSSRW